MRIAATLAFGFLVALSSLRADEPAKEAAKTPPQPPKESYVNVRVEVEIRGQLLIGEKGVMVLTKDRTFNYFQPNEDLTDPAESTIFTLDFDRAKDLTELAKVLHAKEVVVTGMAEMRRYMEKRHVPPGGLPGGQSAQSWHPTPIWIVQPNLQVKSLESVAK